MAQADSDNSTTAPGGLRSPQDSFASLAAAVSPAWHQAILRLASASERVAERLGTVVGVGQDKDPASEYVRNVRELVDRLLELLDGLDPDPDLEPTLGFVPGVAENDECEAEGDVECSLGSLDRSVDQTKAWKCNWQHAEDLEHDDSDDEPSLGSLERAPSCYGTDGPNPSGSQISWASGSSSDLEDEHDGREPEDDSEPSLGSFDRMMDQTKSMQVVGWTTHDQEIDPAL